MSESETAKPLICPLCGSALLAGNIGIEKSFVCHLGHAYSFQELDEALLKHLHQIMYTAVRRIQERTLLMERMAESGVIDPVKAGPALEMAQRLLAIVAATTTAKEEH